MVCPKCGHKLKEDARFCTKCGAKSKYTESLVLPLIVLAIGIIIFLAFYSGLFLR